MQKRKMQGEKRQFLFFTLFPGFFPVSGRVFRKKYPLSSLEKISFCDIVIGLTGRMTMLNWMHIKNLALVEEAFLEFGPSFNVITGETGAGKSVIMSGAALLLGARADKSAIRFGKERCEVAGEFILPSFLTGNLAPILEEAGIPLMEKEQARLLIKRVITPSSTRNMVNDTPVTLQTLRMLGEILVDTHSSHESRHLFDPGIQLDMLDRFGSYTDLLSRVKEAWKAWELTRKKIREFEENIASPREIDHLKYDAEKIREAAPEAGEEEPLAARHALAASSRNIIEIATGVTRLLTEEENSLADTLGQARRVLSQLERFDPPRAEKFLSAVEEISAGINDLSGELADYASEVDIDEREFQAMEERLGLLANLKRKYGPTLEEVIAYYNEITGKIDLFENSAAKRKALLEEEKEALNLLRSCAGLLTDQRKKAALSLAEAVEKELRFLGFKKAAFQLEILPGELSEKGQDAVEYLFSANEGVPPMPLREVASSGETSRVMLGIKTILADVDQIPILIFDEVDANIGGETAKSVGAQIASLGKKKQILCISHLPQVAACAATHFAVDKKGKEGEIPCSCAEKLDEKGRINEIARMLGGSNKEAIAHASALLGGKKG